MLLGDKERKKDKFNERGCLAGMDGGKTEREIKRQERKNTVYGNRIKKCKTIGVGEERR